MAFCEPKRRRLPPLAPPPEFVVGAVTASAVMFAAAEVPSGVSATELRITSANVPAARMAIVETANARETRRFRMTEAPKM